MKIKNILFFGILTIIIILTLFNLKVNSLKIDLNKACVVNYTSYLASNTCPCTEQRRDFINISFFNITLNKNNINMSKN